MEKKEQNKDFLNCFKGNYWVVLIGQTEFKLKIIVQNQERRSPPTTVWSGIFVTSREQKLKTHAVDLDKCQQLVKLRWLLNPLRCLDVSSPPLLRAQLLFKENILMIQQHLLHPEVVKKNGPTFFFWVLVSFVLMCCIIFFIVPF